MCWKIYIVGMHAGRQVGEGLLPPGGSYYWTAPSSVCPQALSHLKKSFFCVFFSVVLCVGNYFLFANYFGLIITYCGNQVGR